MVYRFVFSAGTAESSWASFERRGSAFEGLTIDRVVEDNIMGLWFGGNWGGFWSRIGPAFGPSRRS